MAGRIKGNGIKGSIKENASKLHELLGLTDITVFDNDLLDILKKLADRVDAIFQEAKGNGTEVILKFDKHAEGKGNTYRDLYDAGVKATFKMGIYADREDIDRALNDRRIIDPDKECDAIDEASGAIIVCMCWKDGKLGAY